MKTKLAVVAIISSALPLLIAMSERPHGDMRRPAVAVSYSYQYYPDVEVYYAPERHVYYWADGGAWRSGPRVPPNFVLRSSVRVHLDSPEPYRHHDEIRAKHPRHQEEQQQRGRGPQDRNER